MEIKNMKLKAKSVLKDKFWVVEHEGVKVGNIQETDDGLTVFNHDRREKFKSRTDLKAKYNIVFEPTKTSVVKKIIYDYPCSNTPYNDMYDVKNKLPIFTIEPKSKSFLCAGYYVVDLNGWEQVYCPKLLTLSRNTYHGPYKTKKEAKRVFKKLIK